MKPDYDIIEFKDQAAFRVWLDKHYDDTDGVWVRIFKKATELPTVKDLEALDVCLCYGWIDGMRRGYDEISFLQKYTPRRKASTWSKRNIEFIARLSEAGLMMPSGVAEVERAKADGRWDAAYDRQRDMKVPDDFLAALEQNPKAKEFFQTLNKSSLFAIGWRLQTAKTEATRQRRQDKLIGMLEIRQDPRA